MPSTLLITPQLNQFAERLALQLLNQSELHLLLSPFHGGTILPETLGKEARLNVAFGSAGNKKLVQKIVNENEIETVFLLLDTQNNGINKEQIVPRTRDFLIPLCGLLEALRQCRPLPTLVPVFFMPKGGNFVGLTNGMKERKMINVPIVQSQSEPAARFGSAHALLHSFAVSYRLNVQIALLEGKMDEAACDLSAIEFVLGLARESGGIARINVKKIEANDCEQKMAISKEGIPIAKLLVFGQKQTLLKLPKGECPEFDELLDGNAELLEANTKPGLDTDEQVEDEILAKGASHVVFVCEEDDSKIAAWETGGPAQLRDNVRQNLFTPWLLRQICAKFGIPFLALKKKSGMNVGIGSPSEAASRCEVVRHFSTLLDNLVEGK